MSREDAFQIIATVKSAQSLHSLQGEPNSAFRINASHMTVDSAVAFCEEYQTICPEVPLYLDLQGAKIRLQKAQRVFDVKEDEAVTIAAYEDADCPESHRFLVEQYVLDLCRTTRASQVLIDDGKILIRLDDVCASGPLRGTIEKGGRVFPRKGFNLHPHPIDLDRLTPRDEAFVEATRRFPFVRYALSFASSPNEMKHLRSVARPDGTSIVLAAKLERGLPPAEIFALARASDELWLCRGDLGSQLGLPGLARFYAPFAAALAQGRFPCRVILAGEVCDHVACAGRPTRSEVCHIGRAVVDGYVGCVLSNETVQPERPEWANAAIRLVREVTDAMKGGETDALNAAWAQAK
eukprot:gnl/Trimastix_PCT/1322.p1 GENE.gnl/Trimastix_PCT/1322~~gnl/Trimastix_PCT/1322.p1  ORF type:complete len:352 (-),score=87.24 gnl/Trimastix_PCT/1322:14-1069(-)